MSNILGIIGSPRQFGNCELVVKEISRKIKIQHQLKLLRLSDFEIKLCNGCFRCLFGDQKCVLKDDLYTIVDAIADADALILTVPTYALSANSSLKIVLDRCLALFAYGEKIWGKPAVGVAIAGIPGKEGSALLDVERFLHVILADIKKVEVLYGALPGEIFFKGDNLEITEILASSLFGPKSDKREYSCNVCGGDTFRLLDAHRVKCLLCSNNGVIRLKDGKADLSIEKDDHGMFLSKEDAIQHLNWLRSMKDQYIKNRNKLKEIKATYAGEWDWIKPKNE